MADLEEYTNYFNSIDGNIVDIETYLLNIIGYNYSPKNKNITLYNKSLQLIKKSKTFKDLIKNIKSVVKSLKEVDERDIQFLLEELKSFDEKDISVVNQEETTELAELAELAEVEPVHPKEIEVYGGSPIPDSEWLSLMKKYSPKSTEEDCSRLIHLIRCFYDFGDCPCTEDGIYDKLNVAIQSDRGHWANSSRLNKERPFKELFPRVSTNIAAYLWTVNACGKNKRSIYSYTTDTLRTENKYAIMGISSYLTELYMAIISYHCYEESHRLPLTFGGDTIGEQQYMPILYRGEKLVYNPELLGLPRDKSGKVKWRDVTQIEKNGIPVLHSTCKIGTKCVFSGFTATSPDLSLAGYFCTSKNEDAGEPVTEDDVQVLYVMNDIHHEYAGWFYEVQAFKEKENLCLPGLISEVTDIKYLHHAEAKAYWLNIGPRSGTNEVKSGLNRPLLIITLHILGISGHLPGLDPNMRQDVLEVLNPYVKLLPKSTQPKTLRNKVDRSPSPSPRPTYEGSTDESVLPEFMTIYDNYAIPLTAYIAYNMLSLYDSDPKNLFMFLAWTLIIYTFTKQTLTGQPLMQYGDKHQLYGGGIEELFSKYDSLIKAINKLLSSIEKIGDIISNYSQQKGSIKRKRKSKKEKKGKKGKKEKKEKKEKKDKEKDKRSRRRARSRNRHSPGKKPSSRRRRSRSRPRPRPRPRRRSRSRSRD